MFNYVLVGFDGSDTAQRAFGLALALARAGGGRVRAVCVLPVNEAGADACCLAMTDPGERHRQDLREELLALAPDAADLFDIDVVHGSPGDVLLNQVQTHGADHLVIGHTGRGALARWLLGSVSGDVLARAQVPVTVVP